MAPYIYFVRVNIPRLRRRAKIRIYGGGIIQVVNYFLHYYLINMISKSATKYREVTLLSLTELPRKAWRLTYKKYEGNISHGIFMGNTKAKLEKKC